MHSAAAADGKPTASSGVDSETASPKAKILVVDDQMAVAMMIVFLLTRAGCDAQAALNAEKALKLAQTEKFDLITLDVEMPYLDGFGLIQRLKEIPHLKETPFIFVSGQPTIENMQRAFEIGAADFIEKPFEIQDFISRIILHTKPQNSSDAVPAAEGAAA